MIHRYFSHLVVSRAIQSHHPNVAFRPGELISNHLTSDYFAISSKNIAKIDEFFPDNFFQFAQSINPNKHQFNEISQHFLLFVIKSNGLWLDGLVLIDALMTKEIFLQFNLISFDTAHCGLSMFLTLKLLPSVIIIITSTTPSYPPPTSQQQQMNRKSVEKRKKHRRKVLAEMIVNL